MSLITVPSGAPTNITVESLSSTSLIITWEPPAPSQRNGVITQYRLLVTSDSGETEVYDVSGSLLSREIEGNVLTWCRKLSIVNLTSFFFQQIWKSTASTEYRLLLFHHMELVHLPLLCLCEQMKTVRHFLPDKAMI